MLWKKAFDLVAASTGMILLSPLLLGIAVIILLWDGGPVFFNQQRLGLGKKSFNIWKFRTMRDDKVTQFGGILRQTGLDEFPQIINVLRGEMSAVGPRPLTLDDVQRLGWHDDFHVSRWQVKPGITGLAQLYGGRGAKVSWRLDSVYQQRVSLWFDMWIILMSFAVNVLGRRRVIVFLSANA